MKTTPLPFALFGILACASISAQAAVIYPNDNGFETPNLGSDPTIVFNYGNTGHDLSAESGWTFEPFNSQVGIATNGNGYGMSTTTNGNNDGIGGSIVTTSDLGQAAIFNFVVGAKISQTIALSTGTYTVNFVSEGRTYNGTGGLPLEVGIADSDGSNFIDLGTYVPVSTSLFTPVVSDSFTITTAGNYILSFQNGTTDSTTYGSDTSFFDDVSLTQTPLVATTPEPSTWAMLLLGLGVLAVGVRRRQLPLNSTLS